MLENVRAPEFESEDELPDPEFELDDELPVDELTEAADDERLLCLLLPIFVALHPTREMQRHSSTNILIARTPL